MNLRYAIEHNLPLPAEVETGPVEHKLLLHPDDPSRLEYYSSQLKWRLGNHVNSNAVYMIGVEDDGTVTGVDPKVHAASMATLFKMVEKVNGDILSIEEFTLPSGQMCAEVKIAKHRLLMRQHDMAADVKIVVMGPIQSGKTSMISVLLYGKLDDGRGRARTPLLQHREELLSGRTISRHFYFLPVGGPEHENHIMKDDESDDILSSPLFDSAIITNAEKIVQIVDTPGFPSLTGFACLTGHPTPDHVLITGRDQESIYCKEICQYFGIPFTMVDLMNTAASHDEALHVDLTSGKGVDELRKLIMSKRGKSSPINEHFVIDNVYRGDEVGLVVSGDVGSKMTLKANDCLIVHPGMNLVKVKGMHRVKVQVSEALPGQYVSLNIEGNVELQRGMVLTPAEYVKSDLISACNQAKVKDYLVLNGHLASGLSGTLLLNGNKLKGIVLVVEDEDVDRKHSIYLKSHSPMILHASGKQPAIFISSGLVICGFIDPAEEGGRGTP